MRDTNEKWIGGVREVLQQLFVLGAVGSLFVFVPLHSQSLGAREGAAANATAKTQRTRPVSTGTSGEWSLISKLNALALGRGQGEGN